MKTLSTNELVELLPATPEQLADNLAAFELATTNLAREPGYLKHLVAEGFIEARTVVVAGQPAYLVGWHITTDRGFYFDFVISLRAGVPYTVCVQAVEQAAREKGCRYIRWSTVRRGIVKWAESLGYTPEAVILTKKL